MNRTWILSCTLGEALGIAAVATAYAAADRGLLAAVPAVLAAGAFEGLALGTAQALVLRRRRVAPVPWVAATVAAAVLGYGLSLLGGAGQGGADPAQPGPPLALILGAALLLGGAMGAIMGAAQWAAARHALVAGQWILRNIVGWALAMAAIFSGSASAQATMPLVAITGLGLLSGAVAGAFVGLATAPALPRPQPET